MSDIVKSIEIECPRPTVYNQWTQFEEFPHFMEGIKEVKQLDPTHLRWHATIGGKDVTWESEITEQIPDERISWRSTTGVPNAGTVRFDRLPPNRTRVTLTIHYDPEGVVENVGDALGVTARRIEGDLDRFKEFIEKHGAETGQWRGEVHHGQFVQSGGAAESAHTSRPASRRGRPVFRDPFGGGWDDPYGRMRILSEEIERFAERFQGAPRLFGLGSSATDEIWTPQIELARRGDELIISTDLPGTRKEDVHIDIEDDRIVIEGERRCDSEQKDERVHRSECNYGKFYREIALPEDVDASSARASMRDGVLTIRVRAAQARTARRVEIEDMQPAVADSATDMAHDKRPVGYKLPARGATRFF